MNLGSFVIYDLGYGWMAISIVSTACYLVLSSAFMRRHEYISMNFMVVVTHAIATLMLLGFVNPSFDQYITSSALWYNLLMVAALTWVAKMFYFYAYRHIPVAHVTVFSTLTPLYAVLVAPLAGYPLTTHQILGIFIISGSIFAFFSKDFFRRRKMKLSMPSFALICAFISTIPAAVSAYLQKDALLLSDVAYVSLFLCAFSAIASLAYFLLVTPRKQQVQNWKAVCNADTLKPLIAIAILQVLAVISFSAFITNGHPAVGQAIQRISSLLQILLAYYFLNQRLNTRWHLICVGFSAVGVYVLQMHY